MKWKFSFHVGFLYLQLVLDKLAMSLNGYLFTSTAKAAVKKERYEIQMMRPQSRDVNTITLYDFLESIGVADGFPPKFATNEVQRNPIKFLIFNLEK